ncbi:A24 family peptidase [Paenibacillus sp. FSL R5-0527]|uniref:A24 family peptidase n=1 Tax=Paenibacillus sp. FSL R5-0527 TaxID=2975321 RepID=UPI0026D385F5
MGNFMLWGPLLALLGIATYTDLKWRIIPDNLALGGLTYYLLLRLFYADQPYVYYLLGILAGSGVLYIFAVIVPGAFGGGDIKLMAVVGAALGWELSIIFLILTLLGPCLYTTAYVSLSKMGRKGTIPLAPFILLAGIMILSLKLTL